MFKIGIPSTQDLKGLANEIQDDWKKLGRTLGLTESRLSIIDEEEEEFPMKKCYKMFLYLKRHYSSSLKFTTLAAALTDPLVQRRDLAYKYCCITTGSGQIGRELHTSTGGSRQAILNLVQWQQNASVFEVSSNTDLLAGLNEIASEKGYRISDNPGTCNCMFYALSEQLEIIKGVQIHHTELRHSLVQYLRKYPKLVDGTDLFHFVNGYETWGDYLTDMELDGTWGDPLILWAAANCYRIAILVISHYSHCGEVIIKPDFPYDETKHLALGHFFEGHFFGLQPFQVPPEIKARGLEAELAYENALRIGKVKVYRARIMLIGQDRAGKTSLKKSLLGLRFDPEEQSTSGIEVDPSSFKVNVDQVKNWQRTARQEGVSQFVEDLAKMVAGELESEEAKVDLIAQSKPRETKSHKTPESSVDTDRHQSPPKRPRLMSNSSGHHMERSDHQNSQIKIDTSKPPEEFRKFLTQYLNGLNLPSSSAEPVVHVDIWDLAGQQLYYASHPVFLSTRALYLLVFNLSKGLQETAVSYVRQGIHNRRLQNPTGETNLETLLSWLVSIDAFSPTQREAGEKETPYLRPPVLMVGTHADKPFQDIEEMNVQIQKELSGKGYGRHVITQFFSVDNTQSSSDAGVIKLRDEILKVLEREPYMGEEVPVRWFNFEKVVQVLNGDKIFYLNVKDLEAIVKEVCFVEGEAELGVMLNFYHDLGVIIKHGSTVVLQAQWLIDLFKQLITIPHYKELGPESKLIENWRCLEEKGILSMELVRHVFSKSITENPVAEKDILDMMERFGLVAKFATSTQESEQYFVPAQLKSLPKDLSEMNPSDLDPCPLYLDFLSGFVPHGIYYQLVSRCIGWCSENGFGRPPTLYCREAWFFIEKKFIHRLILRCKKRYIKIILKHREPVSEECLAEGEEVAEEVRNFLGRTLQDISQQIPWRGNLKYELRIECPFCPSERRSCQEHGKISCTHEDCLCLLKMAPAGKLFCEKCFCGEVPTLPGLEKWFLRAPSKYDVASTSQVEPVQDCPHLERLKVTLLGEEWTSLGGGLSTFNRELAKHLAKLKHSEVEVTLLVPEDACTQKDKDDAWGNGVRVMEAKKCEDYKPADWLISPPEDFNADVVFGHGRIFGRQAQILKRPPYNCKWIQVVHTDPEELAKYKGYDGPVSEGERKLDTEIALCKIANLVVPVGPKLCDKYSSYLASKPDGNIVPLTPGLFEEFEDLPDLNKDPEGSSEFKVLLCGRGNPEDFELKGYDIAAKAFAGGELRETRCSLLFVGVRDGEQDEKMELLLTYGIDKKQLYVRRFVGSRAKMKDLLCEADLAIMPSRAEGFGLIALEALSARLPILVGGNSGFAQAIRDLPNGKLFIVDSEKPEEWATAIATVEKRHREYIQKIKELREAYGKKYSWREQCETLVDQMRRMVQGVN